MDPYETDFEDANALRRVDARSVDAWIRAAVYAAGDDPEILLGMGPAALRDSGQVELDFQS